MNKCQQNFDKLTLEYPLVENKTRELWEKAWSEGILEMLAEIKKYSCYTLTPEIKDPLADSYMEGYTSCINQLVDELPGLTK